MSQEKLCAETSECINCLRQQGIQYSRYFDKIYYYTNGEKVPKKMTSCFCSEKIESETNKYTIKEDNDVNKT